MLTSDRLKDTIDTKKNKAIRFVTCNHIHIYQLSTDTGLYADYGEKGERIWNHLIQRA